MTSTTSKQPVVPLAQLFIEVKELKERLNKVMNIIDDLEDEVRILRGSK